MSADEWMRRFAGELACHVQDEGVTPADLAACACEAIEEAHRLASQAAAASAAVQATPRAK